MNGTKKGLQFENPFLLLCFESKNSIKCFKNKKSTF